MPTIRSKLAFVLWLIAFPALAPAAQEPGGAPARETPADRPVTAADGKAFRILDRVAKEINRDVIFSGVIPGDVAVNKNPDGELALCINCPAGPEGAGASQGIAAPAESSKAKDPLGVVLALDLTSQWNPRLSGGRFLFSNDSGYDEDDREYEVFPSAGPSTRSCMLGKLLFVTGGPPASPAPKIPEDLPLQIALKRWGGIYTAPIGGSLVPPRKVAEADPAFKSLRDSLKAPFDETPSWGGALAPAWTFKGGASTNALLEAVSLFASDGEQFLVVVDLRKLESKEAAYFWAPYDGHRSVHLDRHVLSIFGAQAAGKESYQPSSFVEYPYVVVVGEYAKLVLTSPDGRPEVTLLLGSCPGCP